MNKLDQDLFRLCHFFCSKGEDQIVQCNLSLLKQSLTNRCLGIKKQAKHNHLSLPKSLVERFRFRNLLKVFDPDFHHDNETMIIYKTKFDAMVISTSLSD